MATPGTPCPNVDFPEARRPVAGWQGRPATPRKAAASTSRTVAFGSLVDLARLQIGVSRAEICDACNTINKGSARYCKGCSHKLPAFYAANPEDAGDRACINDGAPRITARAVPCRAAPWAAFSMAVNLLVVIAAPFVPMR